MNRHTNSLTLEQCQEIADWLNKLLEGGVSNEDIDKSFEIISEFIAPPLLSYYMDGMDRAERDGYTCHHGTRAFIMGMLTGCLHARFKEINALNELMKKGEENV